MPPCPSDASSPVLRFLGSPSRPSPQTPLTFPNGSFCSVSLQASPPFSPKACHPTPHHALLPFRNGSQLRPLKIVLHLINPLFSLKSPNLSLGGRCEPFFPQNSPILDHTPPPLRGQEAWPGEEGILKAESQNSSIPF